MKKFYTLLLCIFSLFTASAQFGVSNDIEVQAVLSPSSSQTYNTVDTFDIIVRIKNNGPNTLLAGDEFKVNFSIGDGSSNTISVDTLILVGSNRNMQIGEGRNYTLAKDFIINGNNIFSACADVSGTTLFPTNTNKFPGECEQFVVDIEEPKLKINKAYYDNSQLFINLSQSNIALLNIYDITGKLILSKANLNGSTHIISLPTENKGFYFLTALDKKGNQSTTKFVIN